MNKQVFNPNNKNLSLKEQEVHIWNFDLNLISDEDRNLLKETLSEDELQRASKFHFEKDRERFIAGSGLLRTLIGSYLNTPTKDIYFEQNKFGKPEILKKQNKRKLYFNMSNSQNFVSIGFIKNKHIGVDIEFIKPIKDYLDVAENFFSESEKAQLKSFIGDKALEAFYTCWTGKEAFIKFLGEGLSHPLKEFDVQIRELRIGESYRYHIQTKNREEKFFIEAFRLRQRLVGAYALKDKPKETRYWLFDEASFSVNSFIEKMTK